MNIKQLRDKVEENGVVRAYCVFNIHNEEDDLPLHRGLRGDLYLYEGRVFFASDIMTDKDVVDGFYVERADWVHAPSIGHYSW